MRSKPLLNPINITIMLSISIFFLLFFSGFFQFSSYASPSLNDLSIKSSKPDPFTDLLSAFRKWDSEVGCLKFREKFENWGFSNASNSLQFSDLEGGIGCGKELKLKHVNVLVKGWTWIPDNLENLYECKCGLSCFWTKSSVLADPPDALLFETTTPPLQRRMGDPLRIYMDLEAGRRRSGREDIFISYHAEDDVQATYAGGLFHNNRNYQVSSQKKNDTLVYWSSSRCLPDRNDRAKRLLSLIPHHSFGKCLNNVGGLDKALSMYPECMKDLTSAPKWWDHLHCAMSHYKFVLAIENTMTESYVTEKLYYALDAGSVPIYFGAPNVWDFVPPHSIVDGSKFSSLEELASYIKTLANDPVAYAEYHAWRRCGVLGNYGKTLQRALIHYPAAYVKPLVDRVEGTPKLSDLLIISNGGETSADFFP